MKLQCAGAGRSCTSPSVGFSFHSCGQFGHEQQPVLNQFSLLLAQYCSALRPSILYSLVDNSNLTEGSAEIRRCVVAYTILRNGKCHPSVPSGLTEVIPFLSWRGLQASRPNDQRESGRTITVVQS